VDLRLRNGLRAPREQQGQQLEGLRLEAHGLDASENLASIFVEDELGELQGHRRATFGAAGMALVESLTWAECGPVIRSRSGALRNSTRGRASGRTIQPSGPARSTGRALAVMEFVIKK
jgi:hypothetical protein